MRCRRGSRRLSCSWMIYRPGWLTRTSIALREIGLENYSYRCPRCNRNWIRPMSVGKYWNRCRPGFERGARLLLLLAVMTLLWSGEAAAGASCVIAKASRRLPRHRMGGLCEMRASNPPSTRQNRSCSNKVTERRARTYTLRRVVACVTPIW